MRFQELVTLCESDENPRVAYFLNGKLSSEEWFDDNDLPHREDGPAIIKYFRNGGKSYEMWLRHGVEHRIGAPNYTQWNEKGNKEYETWRVRGKLHRIDGPALWYTTLDGTRNQLYWINGKEYTKEEFDEYVKGLESKEDKELLGDLGQSFE